MGVFVRVLVTGAAGFLGRHFTKALRDVGHEVEAIDIRAGLGVTQQDARDLFRKKPEEWDLVLHLAAVVNGREAIEHNAMSQVVDFELDAALFRWANHPNVKKIVYFSSSAAYPVGYQGTNPCTLSENLIDLRNPKLPDALYGWTKLTGEYLAAHARQAGMDVLVVRPFSGYGTDQDLCYPFPAMIERAKRREDPFVVWGSGEQVRDFIHVDDIVWAVLTLVKQGVKGPINIGTGVPTSMIQLAKFITTAAGYSPEITPLSHKPSGVTYRVADNSFLTPYYKPQVSLTEGILRALEGK